MSQFLGCPEATKAFNENAPVPKITNTRWLQRESTKVIESSNQSLSPSVNLFGFNENQENHSPQIFRNWQWSIASIKDI
jgi:hypothetical protein